MSGRVYDPIPTRIAELMSRIAYLDDLDEQQGFCRWRARESDALTWAVEQLTEAYPESVDDACQIAAGRVEYRRTRKRDGF